MKKVILLALFMPVMAYGQIIENFESGSTVNWVQKPEEHWNADNTTPVSGLRSLHHTFDNADSGTGLAGMYLKNLHPGEGTTRWSFTIRYGCEPSSSNNWVLFLTSDQDPGAMHNSLKTNGYAVGVNQTGYDDILRLWKVTDGVFSELISSSINWQTDIGLTDAARIVIERTISGQWSIEVFRLNGTPLGSAAGSDQALIRTGWFVILYRYTSTRDRLFWFDDLEVSGVFYEDLQPPDITGCEATGKKSVLVSFSEEPLAETFIPSNFSLVNAANTTLNVIREGTYSCRVIFENEFANKNKTRLIKIGRAHV